MAKKTAPLLPFTDELLRQFGERLRLARQRRRLSAKQVAQRAGMSPMTLRSLERGGSGVTMGAYLAVMQVLGIENDLGLLGQADPQGRALQDARLPNASKKAARVASPAHVSPAQRAQSGPLGTAVAQVPPTVESLPHAPLRATAYRLAAPNQGVNSLLQPTEDAQSWREQSGFIDSKTLAGLIHPLEPVTQRKGR